MISIVVPVFNAENYLKKCIESILEQTYPVWELILIDNGSEDSSFRICQEYAKKDARITLLRQHQNRGVSVARNLALQKACGKYITFLDADDWAAPDYLEQLMGVQKKTDADMVVCQYEKVYDEDRIGENSLADNVESSSSEVNIFAVSASDSYKSKEYTVSDYLEKCLLEGYTHCWGVLYKTTLLEGVRFPVKITIGEDALFLIDAVLQAKKIVVTQYPGYKYYINENGAMKRKFTLSYMDQITCWQRAMDKLIENYPNLKYKLESILVVSTMLVVGKIAVLDKEEQDSYLKEQEKCHKIIREYGRKQEVRNLLPSGYLVKVKLYDRLPDVYLKLYGRWKK